MRGNNDLCAAVNCLGDFRYEGQLPDNGQPRFWLIKDVHTLAINVLIEQVKDGLPVRAAGQIHVLRKSRTAATFGR